MATWCRCMDVCCQLLIAFVISRVLGDVDESLCAAIFGKLFLASGVKSLPSVSMYVTRLEDGTQICRTVPFLVLV